MVPLDRLAGRRRRRGAPAPAALGLAPLLAVTLLASPAGAADPADPRPAGRALAQSGMPGPPPPADPNDKAAPAAKTGGGGNDAPAGMPGPPPPSDKGGGNDGGLKQGGPGRTDTVRKEAPPAGMPGPAVRTGPDPNLTPGARPRTGPGSGPRRAPRRTDPALTQDAYPKHRLTGALGAELRAFFQDPEHPGQNFMTGSLFGEAEYELQLRNNLRFTVKPFFRWDATDQERTHFDLREAYVLKVWREPRLEVRFGVSKVFWGVTESVHLVDIINQDDLVENIDGEDKLGQPMLAFTIPRKWGTVSLYYLPYFRTRTFPGRGGRLRSQPRVDVNQSQFGAAGLGRWYPSFAARYSHTIREFDIGLHYFHGVSRDPAFRLGFTDSREAVLVPVYDVIDQVGFDGQYTKGPWLLKLEAIGRFRQRNANFRPENYAALAAGFEYTFFRIFKSNADLGVLGEYLWDSRGSRAGTPFQNDVFVGFRLALNNPQDTQILAGVIQDVHSPERSFFIEASTRIGAAWKLTVEARLFQATRAPSPLTAIRRDNLVMIELTYNFTRAWTGSPFRKGRR